MNKIIIAFAAFCLSACANPKVSRFPECTNFSLTKTCTENDKPRIIAIFFDGTSNTEVSRTNISKLHHLVTLTDKPHVHTLYVQGVGTDKKLSGNLIGAGLDDRVKLAYHFIASRYRSDKKDKIFVFGFSRGAYTARVLAGMIYAAELPDFNAIEDKAQIALVDEIFKRYKGSDLIQARNAIAKIPRYKQKSTNTKIEFMGLFDTVSALAYDPKAEQKMAFLSDQYLDQVCNVKKVAHAMSIDENRGRTFPPVLMTVSKIVSPCDELKGLSGAALNSKTSELINERIKEVWFSGAHSDVGGGYSDNSDLSGVPLNWMLRQIKSNKATADLLPEKPFVYEDIYAPSHVGEDTLMSGWFYINRNRLLARYSEQMHDNRPLTIHSSVIARRAKIPRTCREYDFSWQKDPLLVSKDSCYKNGLTPNRFKGFGECFKKVPLDNGPLFTLDFQCPKSGKLLIVDEPNLYR